MALDHCRDFFHLYAFVYNPEDLNHTTPFVFFTRWITHFCAPVFTLLAGTSAFLHFHKKNLNKHQSAMFLLSRGLMLILLEVTITRFAWRFAVDYKSIGGLVIWALGWSMIFLGAIQYLPGRIILYLSLLIIFGHNFLDPIHFNANRITELLWAIFHERKFVPITDSFGVNVLYPILPMIGLMSFGYWLGTWFRPEKHKRVLRQDMLKYLGLATVFSFFVLRSIQLMAHQYSYVFFEQSGDSALYRLFKKIILFIATTYGDPSPWTLQENLTYTVISFFNTTKYPMSLMYILMTVGPALVLLSFLENKKNRLTDILQVYGRVPLFYYVLHLFLIHGLAVLLAVLTHLNEMSDIIFSGNWTALSKNYGYNLPTVYIIWIIVVCILYFPCHWYMHLKATKQYKWLSYF